jgi:Leucine-rich repeat (LRR) protein
LKGMPLDTLYAAGNLLTSIEALRGVPLRDLRLTCNQVTDLTPLSGAPIEELEAEQNPIKKMVPLPKLKSLKLNGAQLSDIDALAQSPHLTQLRVDHNPLSSIAALKGLPLLDLQIDSTNVSDLSPIEGSNLETLHISATKVTSIAICKSLKKLKAFSIGQLRLTSLEDLRGLQFDDLFISGNPIESLEPLRGCHLGRLEMHNCPVSSLEPLKESRLGSLAIDGTKVTDLSPLAGMPLYQLNLNGTGVTSLEPLRGMPLGMLLCQDTAVTSLQPFHQSGPEYFLIDCPKVPEEEFEAVMQIWERDPKMRANALFNRTVRTRHNGERPTSALRMVSTEFDGHHYFYFNIAMAYNDARDLAAFAGGHLLTLNSYQENTFLTGFLPGAQACWLGLERDKNGNPAWITGEPYTIDCFNSRFDREVPGPKHALSMSARSAWFGNGRSGFVPALVIEWDY